MPSRQIEVGGGDAAPLSWVVPGAAELHVQAVSAVYDGSAAAADFRPVLDIFSQGGFLVARVFPAADVAAGDTAEVSYFPFSGGQAGGAAAAGSSPYATTPQVIPIFAASAGPSYGSGWTTVRVDTAVRSNAVRTNQSGTHTAAVNDYLTCQVTLGPKGSIWGVIVAYKFQPTGGQFKVALASVASPDPNRPAPNEGTLTDDTPTWIEFAQVADTYAPVAADGGFNGTMIQFRILGEDGAPFTAIDPNGDPYTLFDTIDGGAGVYSLRLRCSGKNAASTARRCEITYLAVVRLDDTGAF